jgi:phenylpyruvate tautomerase PptA (4-oxalocrotonate tautomerase family)
MPTITVKVFEGELTKDQTAEVTADISEAVIPFVGEVVRANTWVLVEEVKSSSRGIGGKAFRLGRPPPDPESAPPDQQPYTRRPRAPTREEKSHG